MAFLKVGFEVWLMGRLTVEGCVGDVGLHHETALFQCSTLYPLPYTPYPTRWQVFK